MMRKIVITLVLVLAIALIIVPIYAEDDEDEVHPVFTDGRINNFDAAAPVAVYGVDFAGGRGLEIWSPLYYFDAAHKDMVVTPQEIAAVPTNPEVATLIDATEDNGIRFYRLPTGEFQLWAITNTNQWYTLTFEVMGQNTGYESAFLK
jgi:hypothetical protein